jgi:hypothetical protein
MSESCAGLLLGGCGEPCTEERTLAYGAKRAFCSLCAAYFDASIAHSEADSAYENLDYDQEAYGLAELTAAYITDTVVTRSDLEAEVAKYQAAKARFKEAQELADTTLKRMHEAEKALRDRRRAKKTR